ncbi:hypothetical protein ACEN2P_06495 [Pedobacter psychrotolerans]|uniref:hypothetical protein n=1 Tax=Pedobacter psychrotolerans TaxID=1843235 RepID=UPI003F961194
MKVELIYNLESIELEDIEYTLTKLHKSFGIHLPSNTFQKVKTFGDICQIFEKNIPYKNEESCTTQQAFYKVRNAIAVSQNINREHIRPRTTLAEIFPRKGRRKKIKAFKSELAIPVTLLTMKTWVLFSIIAGFVISFATFFFSWKFALTGILICLIFNWVATKFQNKIDTVSVGDLAAKIAREHYIQIRRNSNTVNKNEIMKVIQCTFIADHDLELTDLQQDALLCKY